MAPEAKSVSLTTLEAEQLRERMRDIQESIYVAQGQIHRAQGHLNEMNDILSARSGSDAVSGPASPNSPTKHGIIIRESSVDMKDLQADESSDAAPQRHHGVLQAEGNEAGSNGPHTFNNTDQAKSEGVRSNKRPPRYSTTAMTDEDKTFIRLQLNYAKKKKEATYFLKPVDHVKLDLPTYPEIIKHPMDLDTMTKKLGSSEYHSVQSFFDDLQLIVDNAYKFNGPKHDITHAAYGMMAYIDERLEGLPSLGKTPQQVQERKRKASPEWHLDG